MAIIDGKKSMVTQRDAGFTLVELMITVLLAGLIIGSVYTAYLSLQRKYYAQEQVVEMQQTLRAAMDILVRDIRMAGYSPNGSANAGIVTATVGQLRIRQDLTNTAGTSDDGDGAFDGPNEDVTFGFAPADDAGADGVADANVATFLRQDASVPAGTAQDLAENIVAVKFIYIIEDDNGELVPANEDSPVVIDKIRAIQISILARADRPDPEYRGGEIFTPNPSDTNKKWGPYPDQFRRRLMVTTVQCRNLGLKK